jgi:hypothetical protein
MVELELMIAPLRVLEKTGVFREQCPFLVKIDSLPLLMLSNLVNSSVFL